MKVYYTEDAIVIEHEGEFYLLEDEDWDQFINDDFLFDKIKRITSTRESNEVGKRLVKEKLLAPIQNQEIWASGVTYYNSKMGREEESKEAGGSDFYSKVYSADRPELFFKANAHRTVGHQEKVRIRSDSTWDVPEPELTLVITSSGNIVGYTIGNDMSSRSIEGENPLYLPQAKSYDGSAAIGPCIYVTNQPLPEDTAIELTINRAESIVFSDHIQINQIKRSFTELTNYLFRECSFPYGCYLMTGTGIVPSSDFTLHSGDEIQITINPIGTLINTVE